MAGEGVTQEIEGGGAVLAGARFFMMQGADDDGVRGQWECGFVEGGDGSVDPAGEVGLDAALEFEETAGDGVDTG